MNPNIFTLFKESPTQMMEFWENGYWFIWGGEDYLDRLLWSSEWSKNK